MVDEMKEQYIREFAARGADTDRIEVRRIPIPASDNPTHLSHYGEIDITLDPFPWTGHAMACESLWTGVPVITLFGRAHAGRMVASMLKAVGLDDWIADSPEQYLERAILKASDWDGLAVLRLRLRDMMQASPLCNGERFTRGLESAYQTMWECAEKKVSHE
jgi:predicted O-linked N-acetylglucosamine transferase (SPINDLY family)